MKSFRDIEKVILGFYEGFYKRLLGVRYLPFMADWSCVSVSQNLSLVNSFSEREILKAIKALGGNKAPKPDGFATKFLVAKS